MKKIDLGQGIAILANIGVIAGIVFLAFELRQNNSQLESQARFNHYQSRIELILVFATDPELGRISHKRQLGETLTSLERSRMTTFSVAMLAAWEYDFQEFSAGRVEMQDIAIAEKRNLYRNSPLFMREAIEIVELPEEFEQFLNEYIVAD